MPIERRIDDEILTPGPIDISAALDAAIGSRDPAAAIEALAPTPDLPAAAPRFAEFSLGRLGGHDLDEPQT
jgi:hypothetical protein